MPFSIRHTTTPVQAISVLEEIAANAVPSVMAGGTSPSSYRSRYAKWAAESEARLKSIFSRRDAAWFFSSARHYIVISQEHADGHLVGAELASIGEELRSSAAAVRRAMDWLGLGGGSPLVIDTNIVLEYQALDAIDWSKVVSGTARLIVPTRVLGELEDKRFDRRSRLSDVARSELPKLVAWLESGARPGVGVVIDRHGTTIETVPPELEGDYVRAADDEILGFFDMVTQYAHDAKLVTSDGPLRVRAHNRSYALARVPSAFARALGAAQKEVETGSTVEA